MRKLMKINPKLIVNNISFSLSLYSGNDIFFLNVYHWVTEGSVPSNSFKALMIKFIINCPVKLDIVLPLVIAIFLSLLLISFLISDKLLLVKHILESRQLHHCQFSFLANTSRNSINNSLIFSCFELYMLYNCPKSTSTSYILSINEHSHTKLNKK